ncbi:hypothetical protein DIE19_34405 [Burkholderia sp. Bp9126]|nr:hypothetical protein DIE19_34405 [Burkholderia sp. Bp9126]
MVVRGDPPPARGQPNTHFMEDQQQTKLNCRTVRRTGSISYFMLTRGKAFFEQGQQRQRSIGALRRCAKALGFRLERETVAV